MHVRAKILCGLGIVSQVGQEAKAFGAERVLIATTRGPKATAGFDRLLQSLADAKIEYRIFDEVVSDPSAKLIDELARMLRQENIQVIIGIGGGSSLDAAKGAAIVFSNGGSILDYIGENKFRTPPLPIIAVPTTAGTGSEVSWHVSVNDTDRLVKVTVRNSLCVPDVALLDPTLMTTVPAQVAAFTGIDALTHAIEGYVSTKGAWEVMDTIGIKAVELIAGNLRAFVGNRENLEAGEKMLIAAMLGGFCLSHARTGIVHQMARPLGAICHVPHGLANAVLLPCAMEYSLIASPAKFAGVAKAMGINTEGFSEIEAARASVRAVRELCEDIGIPMRLRDIGVLEETIPIMAQDALQGKPFFENPRQGNLEDIMKIYKAVY